MSAVTKNYSRKEFYLKYSQGSQNLEDYKRLYCESVFLHYKHLCKMTKQSFYAKTGSYTFSTKTLACFSKLANAFYPSEIKVVPTNIIELLTPIGQSAWFGDDGNTRLKSGGVHISTESFTWDECQLLCDVLWQKWGIKTSIHKHGYSTKSGIPLWRIYIWERSYHTLRELVLPNLHPSMHFKLPYNGVGLRDIPYTPLV